MHAVAVGGVSTQPPLEQLPQSRHPNDKHSPFANTPSRQTPSLGSPPLRPSRETATKVGGMHLLGRILAQDLTNTRTLRFGGFVSLNNTIREATLVLADDSVMTLC